MTQQAAYDEKNLETHSVLFVVSVQVLSDILFEFQS